MRKLDLQKCGFLQTATTHEITVRVIEVLIAPLTNSVSHCHSRGWTAICTDSYAVIKVHYNPQCTVDAAGFRYVSCFHEGSLLVTKCFFF